MPVNFNPAKIKNVYALLAAFVLVAGTFFITWIKSIDKGNLENKGERILMGFLAVTFFITFLFFSNKILSQNNPEENDTEPKSKKRKEITEIANLEVILSHLKELLREYIEKEDWKKVQQINSIISGTENKLKMLLTAADKPGSSPNRDASNIYSHILTSNR